MNLIPVYKTLNKLRKLSTDYQIFLFSKLISKQIYLRKAAEYLDDKQIEDDMDVPIDRFLLPKDLQAMLEVFLNELHESRIFTFQYC